VFKETVVLEVDGLPIVGQFVSPDINSAYPMVCLCHGVPAGGTPDPNDGGYPALTEKICREGYAAYFFNFRGTGESGGNLDILGWTRDLKSILDYLSEKPSVDKSRLFLCGFSAGAAVSIYVAAHDDRVSGVAVCACPADFFLFMEAGPQSVLERFRKIGAIEDPSFPPSIEEWFHGFNEVTPINHVDKISPRALLIVHGDNDETVPLSHARKLMGKAGEPKKLVIIAGAGHRLRRDDRAVAAVLEWLKSRVDG
jgi:uncharacterized protein